MNDHDAIWNEAKKRLSGISGPWKHWVDYIESRLARLENLGVPEIDGAPSGDYRIEPDRRHQIGPDAQPELKPEPSFASFSARSPGSPRTNEIMDAVDMLVGASRAGVNISTGESWYKVRGLVLALEHRAEIQNSEATRERKILEDLRGRIGRANDAIANEIGCAYGSIEYVVEKFLVEHRELKTGYRVLEEKLAASQTPPGAAIPATKLLENIKYSIRVEIAQSRDPHISCMERACNAVDFYRTRSVVDDAPARREAQKVSVSDNKTVADAVAAAITQELLDHGFIEGEIPSGALAHVALAAIGATPEYMSTDALLEIAKRAVLDQSSEVDPPHSSCMVAACGALDSLKGCYAVTANPAVAITTVAAILRQALQDNKLFDPDEVARGIVSTIANWRK